MDDVDRLAPGDRRAVDRDDLVADLDARLLGWALLGDSGNAEIAGGLEGDADAAEPVARRPLIARLVGRGVTREAVERAGHALEHGLVDRFFRQCGDAWGGLLGGGDHPRNDLAAG